MITAGRVVFGKTVPPEQYHSNKAEVEFSWIAPECSTEEQALIIADRAQNLAIAKVYEILSTKKPAAGAPAPKVETPAATPATGGRTKQDIENEKMAELNAAKAPAATPRVPRAAAKPKAEEPKPQINTNPEDRVQPEAEDNFDDFNEPAATPVVTITDADLTAACTKANGVIKDGIAIRGLATECGATTGVSSIPNERRQEFLNKLEALKKDKTPAKAA